MGEAISSNADGGTKPGAAPETATGPTRPSSPTAGRW
jgi:hypothetical protein